MQAGTLNEVIQVWRQSYDTTEFGDNKTERWEKHIRTKANVVYDKGARINDNGDLFFSQDIIFNVRIYHDIKFLDQIEWKSNRYRITNIWPDKTVQRLIITTELIND